MLDIFKDASGFIFDCDGTLLDSMRMWDEVEEYQFRSTGHDFTMEELEEIRSVPMNLAAEILHNRYGLGTSPEDVLHTTDSMLLDFYQNKVEPLPGAREFVAELRAAGIPCSVVSSSPDRYIFAGFRHAGMFDDFAAIISTDTAGFSKQDPRIYELAMERMGSRLESTWGADDSVYAIKVMSAMGLKTIGAYDGDGTGTFEELGELATVAIRSFEELL